MNVLQYYYTDVKSLYKIVIKEAQSSAHFYAVNRKLGKIFLWK